MELNIKEEFNEYPGLRYCSLSSNSGEEFYHKLLNERFKQALDDKESLIVILDGTAGYSPSFLDEAFGNLVYDFSRKLVDKTLKLVSTKEPYIKEFLLDTFKVWEKRRKDGENTKVTSRHAPWWRLVDNNNFEKKEWINV